MDHLPLKQALQLSRAVDILLGGGKAGLVVRGGQIVNVITREIYPADVAVTGDAILCVGNCDALTGPETQVLDAAGRYVIPGLIDAHMHFESSMLTCSAFSGPSIASGTTTLFADPHEIANVLGTAGIRAMLQEAKELPNRIFFTIPALTPDVPGLETAGADLRCDGIAALLQAPNVQGLGEMQGVSNPRQAYCRDRALIDDMLSAAFLSGSLGKTAEGNAPGLSGAELAAHILVCGGETSCHETTTKEECLEKLRNGVTVFMREGSTQKNMAACIRVVTEDGVDSRKLVLCTDDMTAADLLNRGHMAEAVRRTIAQGIDPVEAIQMATVNPALHYGHRELGVIAPGKCADLCLVGDLTEMDVQAVVLRGKLVAENGAMLRPPAPRPYPDAVRHSVKNAPVHAGDLALNASGRTVRVRGVGIIPDQNLTDCVEDVLPVKDGVVQPDTGRDLLAFDCVERHGRRGGIGKAFVRGLGLKQGAIALSVGHDAHNLMVAGADYHDMAVAVNRVTAMQGGIALVLDGRCIGDLPLPVAGLMSDVMTAAEMSERLTALCDAASRQLGVTLHDPFMHLSFSSLVTSPKWKLTDLGLIDTERGQILDPIIQGRW